MKGHQNREMEVDKVQGVELIESNMSPDEMVHSSFAMKIGWVLES